MKYLLALRPHNGIIFLDGVYTIQEAFNNAISIELRGRFNPEIRRIWMELPDNLTVKRVFDDFEKIPESDRLHLYTKAGKPEVENK